MQFIPFNATVEATIVGVLGSGEDAVPANRPDLHGDLPGLPAALGRGAARIHAVPLPDVEPFDIASAINARQSAGLIKPSAMPEPYDRYDTERLVEIWTEAELPSTYTAEPVVLAGSLSIDRMLLAGGELAGIAGSFGLVGDRHLDLAVLQHSVHRELGAEAVFGFYESYGEDPNIVALDHFVLAALLLGWIV